MKKVKTTKNSDKRFNHEAVLEREVSIGAKGKYKFVRCLIEVINNAFDAGSTEVVVGFGIYQKKRALFIYDDGTGFLPENIDSVMKYGFSSKSKRDRSTSGKNGTGLKSALGLHKDPRKPMITILSKTVTGEHHKIKVDFEYLLAIAKNKKINDDEYCTKEKDPAWNIPGRARLSGSVVIITGFEARSVSELSDIELELGSALTSRQLPRVFVKDGEVLRPIKNHEMQGEWFTFSDTTKNLGVVSIEVYAKPNYDFTGPVLCGPMNPVISISDMISDGRVRSIDKQFWSKLQGFIYIEVLNEFRDHYSRLEDDFYDTCLGELSELLSVFGSTLEDKIHKASKDESMRLNKEILKDFGKILSTISPSVIPVGAQKPQFHSLGSGEKDTQENELKHTPSNRPYISGPSFIDKGESSLFSLRNYDGGSVYFSVDRPDLFDGVKIDGTLAVTLTRSCATTDVHSVFLGAYEKNSNKLIASKRLSLEKRMSTVKDSVKIGECSYMIQIDTIYPDSLGAIDDSYSEEGHSISTIFINPIHPRLETRQKNSFYVRMIIQRVVLLEVVTVAALHQTSLGLISTNQALELVSTFYEKALTRFISYKTNEVEKVAAEQPEEVQM
ncbi:MAG: ATP-binding protein [Candidatus Pacebacteria bacterium]|nr:ATP-binding protein [Candidatus Paceibacterota bacterium]MBP9780750.1 ATP-binding protein [Candidatus Paceibacterota bacterium]